MSIPVLHSQGNVDAIITTTNTNDADRLRDDVISISVLHSQGNVDAIITTTKHL
jgi:hypothetical protein